MDKREQRGGEDPLLEGGLRHPNLGPGGFACHPPKNLLGLETGSRSASRPSLLLDLFRVKDLVSWNSTERYPCRVIDQPHPPLSAQTAAALRDSRVPVSSLVLFARHLVIDSDRRLTPIMQSLTPLVPIIMSPSKAPILPGLPITPPLAMTPSSLPGTPAGGPGTGGVLDNGTNIGIAGRKSSIHGRQDLNMERRTSSGTSGRGSGSRSRRGSGVMLTPSGGQTVQHTRTHVSCACRPSLSRHFRDRIVLCS